MDMIDRYDRCFDRYDRYERFLSDDEEEEDDIYDDDATYIPTYLPIKSILKSNSIIL